MEARQQVWLCVAALLLVLVSVLWGTLAMAAPGSQTAAAPITVGAADPVLTFVEFRRDGFGGVDGLRGAYSVMLSPDGKYLYAAGLDDDAVAVFSRDSTTGVLTFVEVQRDGVGGVDGLLLAQSVTVSPDGKHLYAAGANDDAVAVFSRDSTAGGGGARVDPGEIHRPDSPQRVPPAPGLVEYKS